jgi:hypothetical protein
LVYGRTLLKMRHLFCEVVHDVIVVLPVSKVHHLEYFW